MTSIIRQLVDANSHASREEVIEAVLASIEAEIPAIIHGIKIPKTPPLGAIARRKARSNRLRKQVRTIVRERTTEADLFVHEIAKLKQSLDGSSSASFNYISPFQWNDNSVSNPWLPFSYDSQMRATLRMGSAPDLLLMQGGDFMPYTIIDHKQVSIPRPNITLDSKIKERILSDTIFGEFLRIIETSVRRFVLLSSLQWDFEASIQTDFEEPSWERIVLLIKPQGKSFEDSLLVWDKIGEEVRKALENASARLSQDEFQKLKKFGRNFFIEMDLS